MKPTLKAPESKCLNLKYGRLLLNVAFNLDLRRYTLVPRARVNFRVTVLEGRMV